MSRAAPSANILTALTPEFYYLLEGELEVTDNGEKTTFHPGDAMFTACGETHSARNNTQKDAKLLAIVIA